MLMSHINSICLVGEIEKAPENISIMEDLRFRFHLRTDKTIQRDGKYIKRSQFLNIEMGEKLFRNTGANLEPGVFVRVTGRLESDGSYISIIADWVGLEK